MRLALPAAWLLRATLLSMVLLEVQTQTIANHKPTYIWQTGPWGRCMGSECGPGGSQSRAVWCAHSEGWTTLHTNCLQGERPDNQQTCFRVCDWHKELYDWQLGAWNQCVPVSLRNPAVTRPAVCTRGEEGIQTREVACVQKSNSAPADDTICEYFEPKPRLEQACLIPCPQDCVVSEFSLWSVCSKTCGVGLQNRIRSVLSPPLFGGSACPNLTEFQTCHEEECEGEESRYSLRVGSWGDCTMPPLRLVRQAEEEQQSPEKPARPKRPDRPKRKDRQNRLDRPKRKDKPNRPDRPNRPERPTLPDRPKRPDRPNRKNKQNRPDRPDQEDRNQARQERQARRRKNKELKRAKGERVRDRVRVKDPETRELIKKKRTRNRLNRQGGKFWDLQVGYQTREVTCVHKNGTTAVLSLCDQHSLPVTYQACVLTKACEVSEWSEWSACSKECYDPNGTKGQRTRTRHVQQFNVAGGAECPGLEESEPCSPQGDGVPPCVTYTWKTTEWTECRVDVLLSQQDRRRGNQTGLCGGGIQNREVYCVQVLSDSSSGLSSLKSKEASRPVSNDLCLGISPNTSQLCQISCPVECEVSSWSAWGPCSFENCQDQSSKKGFKLRRRKVLNEPTGGTGSCPHLTEAIPCEEPSCYDWLLLKLEECVPDNDKECGPGTQDPQVQCVNSEGEFVDRQMCRDAILPMPALCEVPCTKDCVLSPWTSWSLCSHTCSGKNTEGKQTRSRSILAYAAGDSRSPFVSFLL